MNHGIKAKAKTLLSTAVMITVTLACCGRLLEQRASAAEAVPGPAAGLNVTNAPTPPTSPGSFFSQAVNYFSSFDTNLDSTFGANRGTVWTSVDAIQGGPASLANDIGISYDIWRATPATNQSSVFGIGAESVLRTGGVTGALISEGVGLQLGFTIHDVKLIGYADGVYNFSGSDQLNLELGLRVMKALGAHTFAGVGMGFQVPSNIQIFAGFVGFTF